MPVGAGGSFPVVLPVAPPDHLAVGIVAVPYLAAEGSAAAAAEQPVGKQAFGAGVAASALSTLHFQLHQIEYLPADNPRMAVLHKELRRLTLVDFGGFGKKIHRECLLELKR